MSSLNTFIPVFTKQHINTTRTTLSNNHNQVSANYTITNIIINILNWVINHCTKHFNFFGSLYLRSLRCLVFFYSLLDCPHGVALVMMILLPFTLRLVSSGTPFDLMLTCSCLSARATSDWRLMESGEVCLRGPCTCEARARVRPVHVRGPCTWECKWRMN